MFFVKDTIDRLLREFEEIPDERRKVLKTISAYVAQRETVHLVFICTHNSRRSHIAQIWTQIAVSYFNIPDVTAYSGGTEATAFNPRAVDALRGIGFKIEPTSRALNPRYVVRYSDKHPGFEVFSKKYDDVENPDTDFVAIMTCTQADGNCPIVIGASDRISLPYDDPKDFDGTDIESLKYKERSLEIGREILFTFSQITKR
jgi:arsenate reductase